MDFRPGASLIRTAMQHAAGGSAPDDAVEALCTEIGNGTIACARSARALSALIGQATHESGGYRRRAENLNYTTPERISAVWPTRFPTPETARHLVRSPEKLAEAVYGGRLGNVSPGDGYRFRGRGFLQLTGRYNYEVFGVALGLPLIAHPEMAEDPDVAWRIADRYFTTRRRAGKSAIDWADEGNVEQVTRIVNGGVIGLEDRRRATEAAFLVLSDTRRELKPGDHGDDVAFLQDRLVAAGYPLGAIDGHFGPRTEAAVRAFQRYGRADGGRLTEVRGTVDDDMWRELLQPTAEAA